MNRSPASVPTAGGLNTTPFAELSPHRVLDTLDAVGLLTSGELLQLNSFENRVFQVRLDDGRFVVAKFYRSGRWSDAQIVEEHQFALDLIADEVPVAAPLTLSLADQSNGVRRMEGLPPTLLIDGILRMGVCDRLGGRAPELHDLRVLTRIGAFLGRIHGVGARRAFAHRHAWADASPGRRARDYLIKTWPQRATLPARWVSVSDQAMDLVTELFAKQTHLRVQRIHGDCHPGNLLWSEQLGPQFVDWDDACMGPAVQDFWMLLSGDPNTRAAELGALLEGYEAFREFDPSELSLIEALRTQRMIHHSAWLAQRWDDPAFPAAFTWFGEQGYWEGQVNALQDQIDAMQAVLNPSAW